MRKVTPSNCRVEETLVHTNKLFFGKIETLSAPLLPHCCIQMVARSLGAFASDSAWASRDCRLVYTDAPFFRQEPDHLFLQRQ